MIDYSGFTPGQRYVLGKVLDTSLRLTEDAKGNPYLVYPDGGIERVHKRTVGALTNREFIERNGSVYHATEKGMRSYEASTKSLEGRKRNASIRTQLEKAGGGGVKESGLLAARNGLYVELFSTLIREVADLRVSIDNLTKALL